MTNKFSKLSIVVALLAASTANSCAATEGPVVSRTLTGALLSAQVAEGDNDFASMISYYKQALGFEADNTKFEQNLMLGLITNGQFTEALPYAEKLKAVPEIERVSRVALAIDAVDKKKWDDAETLLKLAQQSDLDRLVANLMTGWVKLGAGNGKDAAEYISKIQGPQWVDLFKLIHKAMILDASGDKAAAAAAYEEALNSADAGAAPDSWLRMVESYARFQARDGKKDAALKIIDQGLEVAPERPPLLALRKTVEAGSAVEPLVADAKAGLAEVLFDIGAAVRRDGSESFSTLYLQLSLAAKPDNDVTLIQLAGIAEGLNQQDLAITNYRAVPEASPFKRAANLQMSLNLADLDKTDEAIKELNTLMTQEPSDPRTYTALGGVYAAKKDFKSAAEIYDKAVVAIGAPDRKDWNLYYQRGIAHERTKTWPVAEESFKQALKLYPDQPQVLNYLGYSYVDMNQNLDEALGMIRKAVELRPDDGYIVDSLGWAYYRLGKFDDAVTELQNAISLRPEDATINDHLGDAYWRAGRKLEANFQWQHALDAKSDDVDNVKIKAKMANGKPVVAEANTDKKG
jgi:tetratricopeptide (TPR) repeat protein